ncbi:AraC family transcriptional regulator [Mucilaginibacter ginsenosidivorans]|uniref:Helix-turn-helix domain-containing protein n=1 Tax=Mucilaginibacter ginsenosidivorans TaxID=398053 RepID=A0A5B8UXW7_9SPHI|nr:AraC family transcriptional regulator [Mucilaginibacter ginsenosidivorans]QEC63822.1 helix-turn-helix domain-containing protein [Mucilaginibacter ginsenosidivorans]
MYASLVENIIPKYSLKQASDAEFDLFMIKELNGEYSQHPSIFLAPHRKDYYLFAFVKDGSSRHWVDMTPYVLKPDTFYFSVPHQVHVKEHSRPLIGTMLCFTDDFLAMEENLSLRQLPVIQNLHNGHELNLTTENVKFIEDIMAKMLIENSANNNLHYSMLLAYLRVLLIYLSRIYTEQFVKPAGQSERVLLNRFKALIEERYLELHDVAGYADLLHISGGHLNDVVKFQSGKTAIEHIHERLTLEAKRLLFHTEHSIKEIAYRLGFYDASYFNRFFKRISGQTPLMFRNSSREMYH